MILPLSISYLYGENQHNYFLLPIAISFILGLFSIKNKYAENAITFRESVLIVVLTWISVSLFAAIPFYLSNQFPSYLDSFFEALSGFTATGSTILSDIEALPQSILFWRSEIHWLGGMGIIVLAIIVLPKIRGNKFLFEQEAPIAPEGGKLFSRTKDIAKTYWKIYIGLTLIEILFLLPVMNPIDAVIHTFSSLAGGGFSSKNNSIAYFNSIYIELVLSLFMLAGATSFILHFQAIVQRRFVHIRNTTFKIFISIIVFATLLVTTNLFLFNSTHITFLHALRISFFQVVSIITTTGFATADFKYWPQFSQLILILLMFVGGMSASTSGSIKISRLEVLFKDIKKRFKIIIHPNSVFKVIIGNNSLSDDKIEKVYLFIYAYIIVFVFAGLLLIVDGNSLATSFTAVITTLGNIGPGLDAVGPFDNFLHFSDFSKIVLSFCMLLGRLEIWGVLLLFSKYFWTV